MRRTITTALLAALAVLAVAGMAVPAVAQSPDNAALNETVNFTEGEDLQNVTVDVEFNDPGNVTVYPVAASNQTVYVNASGSISQQSYTKGDVLTEWTNQTIGANSSQFDAYTVTVWESGTVTTNPPTIGATVVNNTFHVNFTANTTNPDGSNDTAALETLIAQKGDSSSSSGGIFSAISDAGTERIAGFLFVVGIIWVGWKRGFFDR